MLVPTCFGSSLPLSGSLLDTPELLENTNGGVVYLKYVTDNETLNNNTAVFIKRTAWTVHVSVLDRQKTSD
jgi:hypothetical protein